jgi:type VI secretion system protein VasD
MRSHRLSAIAAPSNATSSLATSSQATSSQATSSQATLLLAAVIAALLPVACAKAPPPVPPALTIAAAPEARTSAPMTITVSPEANPDRTGRPSPVVVRIYQLKTDAAFTAASFADLYQNEDKTLGAELITRDEFVLEPKDSRTINVALSGDTRFVGAIAAFRDILNAEWRVVLPAPRKGFTIAVDRARLRMTPTN